MEEEYKKLLLSLKTGDEIIYRYKKWWQFWIKEWEMK